MSSQEIKKTVTNTSDKILKIPNYSSSERLDITIDVGNVLAKSLNNVASCLPGFAEPIARVFLEAMKIADNTNENKKQCNELRRLVQGALEILDKSLARGVRPKVDFGEKNINNYLQILTEITEYMYNLAHPTIPKKIWRLFTSEQITRKIQLLSKELNDMTLNLILSLVINISTGDVPSLPKLDQQLWEITCLLNGAQASKSLMLQFTKSVKDIQEDRSKKRIVRGSKQHVIKKILKVTKEEVAEKPIGIFSPQNEETERQFWSEVAIADYLKDCKYILKFRGIIERNGKRHTIYEWAKHGDLQTYLLTHPNLPWSFRIKVAWEVASALSHCHEKEILHHDVRSHNVMLDENFTAKLTNFETSRPQSGSLVSWPVKDMNEILRWTAPEKTSPEVRYTFENDVYSFGILLWEIASQQRPYADIEFGVKVFDKVLKSERPDTKIFSYLSKDETTRPYTDEYLKIMYEAWHQEPSQRPEMTSLCERLRDLHLKSEDSTILENASMNFFSLSDSESQDETNDGNSYQNGEENKNADELNLEKAQQYHDEKNYTAAWTIYDSLVKKGNSEAKYKAGFYLANGPPYYPLRNLKLAENYIREAADDGHADAQYRYYQLLFKKASKNQEHLDRHKLLIIEIYLKAAAEQNHVAALYTYGEHLFKGTFGHKDPETGHKLLMASHYQMNERALRKLVELEPQTDSQTGTSN